MTDEILKQGKRLKDNIYNLEYLIWSLERQPTGIIVENKKLFLRAIPFGGLTETKIQCDSKLANKIHKLLNEHLQELKDEYENLS